MQSYECVIISKMFLIYFISYGCNGGALVFLGGAEASASPSFALPMFITIKKIIILHLFLGVPAATVGGTGTPWHTRGYAPGTDLLLINSSKLRHIPRHSALYGKFHYMTAFRDSARIFRIADIIVDCDLLQLQQRLLLPTFERQLMRDH